MKKQNYILLSTIGLIAGFVIFTNSTNQYDKNASTVEPLKEEKASRGISSISKSEVVKNKISDKENSNQITDVEIRELNSKLPSIKVVQDEIRANPHTPPLSLMRFAEKLGPMMEKSFRSESAANTMMGVLIKCANDDSIATSARALCVRDTEKISEHHPGMKKQAEELRAGVSPEIQKMLDTNDSMIKR